MKLRKKRHSMVRWQTPVYLTVLRVVWILAMGLVSSLVPLIARADTVTAGGTGGAMGPLQRLGEAFQAVEPQFSLVLVPSLGNSGGIKALLAGAIDLAALGRPLKPEEGALGLSASEYGKTPFVFVTNKPEITGVTIQEAAEIYSGQKTTWADGSRIRLVLRLATDSDTMVLRSMPPPMPQAVEVALKREGMIMAITDQDSINTIAKLPGAFGTSTLALLLSERRTLKPLAVNGVVPNVTTLADGTYPYMKSMSVVTTPQVTPVVQRFLAFLRSEAGQKILHQTGHWVTAEEPVEPYASR